MEALSLEYWQREWVRRGQALGSPDDSTYWDGRATGFAQQAGSSPYVGEFLALLGRPSGKLILDMGSGSGTLALPLAEMGNDVIACDFSPRMLEELELRALERGFVRETVVRGGESEPCSGGGLGEAALPGGAMPGGGGVAASAKADAHAAAGGSGGGLGEAALPEGSGSCGAQGEPCSGGGLGEAALPGRAGPGEAGEAGEAALDGSRERIVLRAPGGGFVLPLRLSWADDWQAAGIGAKCVDVAIASRSTMVDDVVQALEKLECAARERVAITVATEFGPRTYRRLGSTLEDGSPAVPDHILVLNALLFRGLYPTVSYIDSYKTVRPDEADPPENTAPAEAGSPGRAASLKAPPQARQDDVASANTAPGRLEAGPTAPAPALASSAGSSAGEQPELPPTSHDGARLIRWAFLSWPASGL